MSERDSGRGTGEIELLRERVVQALCAHYARDRLTLDELDSRLERAQKSRSDGQLASLVVDLPALGDHPLPWSSAVAPITETRRPAAAHLDAAPYGAVAANAPAYPVSSVPRERHRRLLTIMGDTKRVGAWVPPQEMDCAVVMAQTTLDFRDALLAPGVTEVKAMVIMGELHIIAPPQWRIEVDGMAFMGAFDAEQSSAQAPPDAPVLRITGTAFMGAVRVEVRYPGERRRDARRREAAEQEQLRLRGRNSRDEY